MKVNENFELLSGSYLFARLAKQIREYRATNPPREIIRMDIGDVTRPIIPSVISAMQKAVADMGVSSGFHGYGPEQGYDFLRKAIAENDYRLRGIEIKDEEIFVSDGAKCDIANLTDIFDEEDIVGVPDPVYPVYVDSNIMAGRNTENGRLKYIKCDPQNNYKPVIPSEHLDVIYLCSPNNPTGGVLTKDDLTEWVEYARKNSSLIIFDSAYEVFITDSSLPRSIYEIPGAKEVAIEVRSYSKTAGFTGLRCGYTVVPEDLKGVSADGKRVALRNLWLRRQTTKFNGASYVIQRGAEALYTPEGREELGKNIEYYLNNARILRKRLEELGYQVTGGEHSPYVWFKSKNGESSEEMYTCLLTRCQISSTPGSGFGEGGEGCIRLTGFNTLENTLEAADRLKEL